METCPNCGAALRAGAKFCTTCGTRLNESTTDTSAWRAPANETSGSYSTWETPNDEPQAAGWGTSWKAPETESGAPDASPAARFELAMEQWNQTPDSAEAAPRQDVSEEQPTAEEPTKDNAASLMRFTSASRDWNFGYGADSQPTSSSPEPEPETEPEPASDVPTADSRPEPDAAGFTDGGSDEVDYLSGDENIEVDGPQPVNIAITEPPTGEPTDPRQRAQHLLNELQGIITNLGDGSASTPSDIEPDETGARVTLAGARARLGDYTALQEAIAAVREDPRDIDALRDLAGSVDAIDALLGERDRLVRTIDDALESLG